MAIIFLIHKSARGRLTILNSDLDQVQLVRPFVCLSVYMFVNNFKPIIGILWIQLCLEFYATYVCHTCMECRELERSGLMILSRRFQKDGLAIGRVIYWLERGCGTDLRDI